jgi:ABC-type multidrug transport system ATPase subunit
MLPSTD